MVFATSNLALATEAFADLTGCLPIPGGPHPAMGTRNVLVSFGDGVYLEIIGPDPERKVDGLQAAAMAALERDSLFAWALATTDLQRVALNASRMGLEPSAPSETSRT
ncbi:MAG: VOC family protein, partial [bacterium]